MQKKLVNRHMNKKVLQEILDTFTVITGIRVAFMDEYNSYVVGRNREISTFCSKIRRDNILNSACKACDISAFEKAEQELKPYIYHCHMGFVEAVLPLVIGNNQGGFLMIGQVRCEEDRQNHWENIHVKLSEMGMCNQFILELEKDFNLISVMPMDGIQASVKMLQIIGQYVVMNDIVHISEKNSIEKTKEFLKNNFHHKLDIHQLASKVELNASYLSFIFKKSTGTTLTMYVDKLRIEQAEDLLRKTTKSIKEISMEMGYDDPNYFSRVFKKYMAVSPMIYRKKYH